MWILIFFSLFPFSSFFFFFSWCVCFLIHALLFLERYEFSIYIYTLFFLKLSHDNFLFMIKCGFHSKSAQIYSFSSCSFGYYFCSTARWISPVIITFFIAFFSFLVKFFFIFSLIIYLPQVYTIIIICGSINPSS